MQIGNQSTFTQKMEAKRKIWFFWDRDLKNAPDIVKISYDNWKHMNPDHEIVLLNNENCEKKTGFNFSQYFNNASAQIGTAGKTDFLRLYLLNYFGGIWVDATTFCLLPLNKWLQSGDDLPFFCFKQPSNCPDRQLVSWFLSAEPNNPLIQHLFEYAYSYLFKTRAYSIRIGQIATARKDKYPKLVSREKTGIAYLKEEESNGIAPYFWMFYLFNDAIKIPSLRHYFDKIDPSLNKYCQTYTEHSVFKNSYVSKQKYRDCISCFEQRIIFLKKNNMLSSAIEDIISKNFYF